MAEAGVGEELARAASIVLLHQDAARQNADRAFQHAHVAVEHDVGDVGAVEQRLDGGDQHGVVGADDFAQEPSSRTV